MSQYPPPQYPPQSPWQNPTPYDVRPQAKPGSVTAIGVIGIVLSLLCGGGSAIGMLPYIVQTSVPNPVVDGIRQQGGILTLFLTVIAITLLLQVVLLFGSIGTLTLKRWGRSLMMLYAGGMLLAVVADIALTAIYVVPLLGQAIPSDGSAHAQGFAVGMKVGLFFGAAMRLVFPLCVLAVMNRPNVKAAFDSQP